LTLPKPVSEAFQCNLVEEDARKLDANGRTLTLPVKPFAPLTLKANFAQ